MDLEKIKGFEDLEDEIWREIPIAELENFYDISNMGRVRSYYTLGRSRSRKNIPHIRAPFLSKLSRFKKGYWCVQLRLNRKKKNYTIHSLVCLAFIGACPKGFEVAHINGNKFDNTAKNLVYKTHKDNEADKILHNTTSRGINSGNAKLTEQDVLNIFYSQKSSRELAKEYNLRHPQIYRIRNKTRWNHLTKDLTR